MQMTKKHGLMILAALTMMIAAFIILVSKKNKSTGSNNMLPVVVQSLKMPDGWGYEILVNNKVYIRQDYIPAIPGYKRFKTETEALSIANRVAEKMKQGRAPAVTVQEIDSAHIHY
jgi:hypothetical protein